MMLVIGTDHGNKQMKTTGCPPFVSGFKESAIKPFGKDILEYQNKFYMLSNQRIPYMRDKAEDERFFILTLFAIARELQARNRFTQDILPVNLAVGLPPAHFGALNRSFTEYFSKRGLVTFGYKEKRQSVYIEDVRCYPQAYAAAATILEELIEYPKVLVVDIGGFTADYLQMRYGEGDLSVCDSLENGVILLYNRIRAKVNSEFDILLDEADIDAVLLGKASVYPHNLVSVVNFMAQDFVEDLFNSLRERMLDLKACVVVFVGGGGILLRRQIESSGKVGKVFFVEDINANAKGYERLYLMKV